MRNVYTSQTPAEAHVVAGLLEEEGIECAVEGVLLTGTRMALPMDDSTLPGVFVRDEDAARAAALIAERHVPRDSAEPPDVPDDEMPERPGLVWFKRFLLACVVLAVVGLLTEGVDFVAVLVGAPGLWSVAFPMELTIAVMCVAFAIAYLVVPAPRAVS